MRTWSSFSPSGTGEVVGRIGAIINHNHNREHNENIGFFGFFECFDDQEVAQRTVRRGRTVAEGPWRDRHARSGKPVGE